MADVLSLLPASVLRNLADKLYEKRKNAALEDTRIYWWDWQWSNGKPRYFYDTRHFYNTIKGTPPILPRLNWKWKISNPEERCIRRCHIWKQIVPPVLNSFSDQDSRVRYYACEALYNIAKVARGDFIVFFNQIFDALCKLSADSDANVQSAAHLLDRLVKDIVTESDQFSIEEFIPLLRERMNVLNPYVRQFLSVDYGRMAEILVQRAGSPDEFTRLTAITWMNEFVKLGGDQLVPYYADILGAILPCISDKEEKIRVVARETNEELCAIRAESAEGFDIGAVLTIARRELGSEWEATRLEALHWMAVLLERHRTEQSAAFKILRTRLKTVPAYTFSGEFPSISGIRRTASGNPYAQILSHIPALPSGTQNVEDGDKNTDIGNGTSGINFAMRLQQFEHMQHQHRSHCKMQSQMSMQPRRSNSVGTAQAQRSDELRRTSLALDSSRSAYIIRLSLAVF